MIFEMGAKLEGDSWETSKLKEKKTSFERYPKISTSLSLPSKREKESP